MTAVEQDRMALDHAAQEMNGDQDLVMAAFHGTEIRLAGLATCGPGDERVARITSIFSFWIFYWRVRPIFIYRRALYRTGPVRYLTLCVW